MDNRDGLGPGTEIPQCRYTSEMVGYSGISGRCFDSNTGGKWWCSNRSVVVDNDAARRHHPICIQAIVCRSKLVNEYPGETRLECIDQPETRII